MRYVLTQICDHHWMAQMEDVNEIVGEGDSPDEAIGVLIMVWGNGKTTGRWAKTEDGKIYECTL